MDEIRIRAFAEDDAAVILSWCHDEEAFRRWSADRYESYPAQPSDMISMYRGGVEGGRFFPLTMTLNGDVCGHIIVRYPGEENDVVRFGFVIVDPAVRGKGLGKRLMLEACRFAKETLHAEKAGLGVFENNEPAYRCYLASGFHVVTLPETEVYHVLGQDWNCIELERML